MIVPRRHDPYTPPQAAGLPAETSTWCSVSDLPSATCAHCLKLDAYQPERRSFAASHHGDCAGCSLDVEPGDRVAFNDHGLLCHYGCADD